MVGFQYLATIQTKHTVEWELAPAVMVACGGGFARPAVETPVLTEFLLRGRESISCGEVIGQTALQPLPVAMSERYAIYALGLALRAAGLSWHTLDAYMATLFGVSMALAYAIFRLIVGPALATLGVVGLLWSNQLPALISFRDYGKEPAFFALWLVLGWLIWRGRERASRVLLWRVALAGALTGVGLGFRVDLLAFIPAFVAVIVFAVAGSDRGALKIKACAIAIFLATFTVTGQPILTSMSRGSNSAHVILLGLMGSFNRTLDLQPAPYNIGDTYSDTFAYVSIATYADVVQHVAQPVNFATTAYDSAGGKLLADLVRNFPADVVIRGLAATAQAIRYPFDGYSRGSYRGVPPLDASPGFERIGLWRDRLLGLAEGHELALAAAVLLLVSFLDWQLGLTGTLLILYFCGYAMLQYSRRHIFHLDIIPIGLALLALQAALTLSSEMVRGLRVTSRPQSPRRFNLQGILSGAAVLGTVALLLWSVVAGARWWQQRHVIGLMDRTLAVVWDDVDVTREPLSDTAMRAGAPIATWAKVFAADPDRWKTAVLLKVPRPFSPKVSSPTALAMKLRWIQLEYLQLQFGGACRAASVQVGLKYASTEETDNWQYTRVFDVPVDPHAGVSRLLVPAYYQDGQTWSRFDGFAVPAADVACVAGVWRARDPGDVPLPLLNVVLSPRWRDEPLYQRMHLPPQFTSAGIPAYIANTTHARP